MRTTLRIRSPKMSSTIRWNVAGLLVVPKNMTVGSNSPRLVMKAALNSSPGRMRTLLYPHRTSNFEKYFASWILVRTSATRGSGYESQTV